MNRSPLFFFLFFLIAVPAWSQKNVPREELERRRLKLLQSIKETQSELAATRLDKKATLGQLQALQQQLASRQKLIGSISNELSQLDGNIRNSQSEVNSLSGQLRMLQMRYAQSVRYAYRNRNSQSMLAYLFSASGFNDGIRRLGYLRKFRDYRMAQADQIRIMEGSLQNKIGVLNNEKQRKNALRVAQEQQKLVLQQEANQKDKIVQELKGRESELAASVAKNQRDAKNLDRAISNAIRAEIEIARKKAAEEARRQAEIRRKQEEERQRIAAAKEQAARAEAARIAAAKTAAAKEAAAKAASAKANPTLASKPASPTPKPANPAPKPAEPAPPAPKTTYGSGTVALNKGSDNPDVPVSAAPVTTTTPARPPSPAPLPKPARPAVANLEMTPEAAALSSGFESNRGRLPWPVDKGYIVSQYGRHPHPIAQKVMVENNGIDIQTGAGATARAVFEGTVSKVFSVAGTGQTVLINHGEYFTIYSGLSGAMVSTGQQVRTRQPIGTVGANEEGIPILKFQVWKGSSTQNPTGWIAR